MATKPDLRDSLHGEEEEKPLFGPGSGREDTPAGDPSDPSLYDPQTTPLMDGSDPRGGASSRELAEGEAAGGVGSTGKADKKESSIADKLGKGFDPADKMLPPQAKLAKVVASLFKTKKGRAGLVTGGVVGGLMFIASIGQGPFMLMQLSQILLKPEYGSEKNSSIHFMQLMRYAKTGDFGETRVGYLRSKLKDKYIAEFNRAGINFEQSALGRPSKMTFDTKNPDLAKWKNLSKKEFLAKLGLPSEYVDEVTASRNGSVWSVEFDTTKAKGIDFAEKAVSSTSKEVNLGNVANGKLGSNMRFRSVLRPYFGLPGLLSPISKRTAAAAEKAASIQEARAAEKERASPRVEKIKELSASARGSLRDKLDAKKQAVAAFTLGSIAGACLVHESADDAAEYNYQAIVKGSAAEAIDTQAVGSQVQSGQSSEGGTLSMKAAGMIQRTMIDDDGKSPFASKPLDALARNNKGAKGEDIPTEYQQAFSGKTTADNIRDGTKLEVGGVDVTGTACGPAGQAVGGVFSIVLLLAGPPSGGAAWAAFAAKTGAGLVAGVGAGILLTKLLESDVEVKPPLAGAIGGSLKAYGAIASANMNSMSSGGVELGEEDTTALLQEQDQQENEEFRAKPFFARMFDLYDYRSLASVSLRNYSPNLRGSVSNLGANLSGSFVNLFSAFLPKAYAQEETYDWGGMLRFGLPSKVRDDPKLQDPYENDKKMSDLLGSSGGSKYVEKAKKCFGVEISEGENGWEVQTTEEVNPSSSNYTKAKCNKLDDINWRRTMLFVFQSKDINGLACYEGIDEKACPDTGYGGAETSSDSPSEGGEIGDGFTIEKYSPALSGPGGKITPKGITLHWWAYDGDGDIKSLANGLKGNKTCGSQGCSVQLGITKEGKIWQMTNSLTDLTYHAAGANSTTIGIEIEGTPDQFGREGIKNYPEKFNAVVATVKYLMEKYNIKLDESNSAGCNNAHGVHSHKYYSACNPGKDDVDDYYLSEVRKRVK